MTDLAVGIIGTGDVAGTHAEILSSDERVRVAYLFNPTRDKARAFSDKHGGEVLDDAASVIDRSDVVLITSPNHTHAELTLAALKAKKHVLCEKPFALNRAQAVEIAKCVDETDVVYQLGFSRRFAAVYREMRALIDRGELTPTSFNIKINRGELEKPPWTGNPAITGGFLFETTLHLIDMVRHLMGEVKQVHAIGTKSLYDSVDNFSVLFEMESGVHGVLSSCAHATWIPPFERVELCGRHASAFNHELDRLEYRLALGAPTVERDFRDTPQNDRWGFIEQNRIFIDRVVGKQPSQKLYADAQDGLRNVELVEQIYDQVGLGR